MKTLRTMEFAERRELADLLGNWLEGYTEEVIERVMAQIDDIINNDVTMMMLKELKERQDKEREEHRRDFESILSLEAEGLKEQSKKVIDNLYNDCLTHARAYKDVLYDMYIRRR